MKSLAIPVRVVGAGSQPEAEEELQYLEVSREMDTFRMPMVPDGADTGALAQARALLQSLLAAIADWDPASGLAGPRLALDGVAAAVVDITDEMLGEGEVSIRIDGARSACIQESVFTGLWRVCELDAQGRVSHDFIEVGALPGIVLETAHAAATGIRLPSCAPPGAMNSPALLHEIEANARERRPDAAARVLNLSLFPLTPEDHRVLEEVLPVGPVAIMSRGFGNCRITSTGVRDVWRVQYFNTMNTLILNTLEIVGAPEVALAAPEDLADSRERLAELIAWMGEPSMA